MKIRLFFLIVSVLVAPFTSAVTVSNLYRAELVLPVEADEARLLNRAFAIAAQEVLERVSGNREAIDGRLLKEVRKNAATWVAQHAVETVSELLEVNGSLTPAKRITVTFYEQSINAFLSNNQLPIWGANRPSILLWLATDQGQGRDLAGVASPSILLNDISTHAAKLGLPIYAPLLDDIDKSSLAAAEVWGFFEDSIKLASRRYQTDIVVAVRANQQQALITGDALVIFPSSEVVMLPLSAVNTVEFAQSINEQLAALFTSKYAAVRDANEKRFVTLQVTGIGSFQDLQSVQNYLASIELVRSWHMVSLMDDKVQFKLSIDGNSDKLNSVIALDAILQSVQLSALDPDANKVISFHYNGGKK